VVTHTQTLYVSGCQLKAGYFPLFGGFASLNPLCKVQLAADAGWIKERKRQIH